MNVNGKGIVENIFFTVTCISVFTCVIRSDYNFAMGLLSYYMIKNIDSKKQGNEIPKIARTVSKGSFKTKFSLIAYVFECANLFLVDPLLVKIGGLADSDDPRDGWSLDLRDEINLGRKASEERKRVESF